MHHMRLFRHITAEYICPQCQGRRPVIEAGFSPFHWIAVILASVPVAVVALHDPWHLPLYSIFSVLAAEALAMIAAGFISSIVLIFTLRGTAACQNCGAQMSFRGRHFDLLGDQRPHYSDFVIVTVFSILNGLFWLAYIHGSITG
jgi:hypothetical protein